MTIRQCAWCGADISMRRPSARYCGSRCKDMWRYEQRHGVPPGPFVDERCCLVCGATFTALTATRKYCGKDCRQTAQREMGREANAASARRRRKADPAKAREADRKRRRELIERFLVNGRKRYQNLKVDRPEKYSAMLHGQRERERKRNAERALALLFLPIRGQVDG